MRTSGWDRHFKFNFDSSIDLLHQWFTQLLIIDDFNCDRNFLLWWVRLLFVDSSLNLGRHVLLWWVTQFVVNIVWCFWWLTWHDASIDLYLIWGVDLTLLIYRNSNTLFYYLVLDLTLLLWACMLTNWLTFLTWLNNGHLWHFRLWLVDTWAAWVIWLFFQVFFVSFTALLRLIVVNRQILNFRTWKLTLLWRFLTSYYNLFEILERIWNLFV